MTEGAGCNLGGVRRWRDSGGARRNGRRAWWQSPARGWAQPPIAFEAPVNLGVVGGGVEASDLLRAYGRVVRRGGRRPRACRSKMQKRPGAHHLVRRTSYPILQVFKDRYDACVRVGTEQRASIRRTHASGNCGGTRHHRHHHRVGHCGTVEDAHPPRPCREGGVTHTAAPPLQRGPIRGVKGSQCGCGSMPGVALVATDGEPGIAIGGRFRGLGAVRG